MRHTGHLSITSENHQDFARLQEITGNLTIGINSGYARHDDVGVVEVVLPALTGITGSLVVNEGVTLQAPELLRVSGNLKLSGEIKMPRLASVGGCVSFYAEAEPQVRSDQTHARRRYQLPALSSIRNSLTISADVELPALTLVGTYLHIGQHKRAGNMYFEHNKIPARGNLPLLVSTGGSLTIVEQAELNAPALMEVEGDVAIEADICLPALAYIGSRLRIREGRVQLPLLTSVRGNAEINGNAELPMLTKVEGSLTTQRQDLELPILTSVEGDVDIKYRIVLPMLVRINGNLSVCYQSAEMPALEYVGGNVEYGYKGGLSAPFLASVAGYPYPSNDPTRHIGDLVIETTSLEQYKFLTEVTGNLTISAACELPQLVRVGGLLLIQQDAQIPKLQNIGTDLVINYRCQADLPELLSVGRSCVLAMKIDLISTDVVPYLPKLVRVGGNLDPQIGCEMPALSEVGGDLLSAWGDELPKLYSVNGSVTIRGDAKLPMLTSIGGSLYVKEYVELPRLMWVYESVFLSGRAKLPLLMSVGHSLEVSANSWIPLLKEIGKDLTISAHVQLPALACVGGSLQVNSDVNLPSLAKIGGDLICFLNHNVRLPSLVFIGANLNLRGGTTAQLPNVAFVGGVRSILN